MIMKVEKIISNAMKKVGLPQDDNEAREIDTLKSYDISDPELTDKLSKMLIKEINKDER